MWGVSIRRVLVASAVVVPIAIAVPAGAASKTATIQAHFNRGGTQAYLQDGVCPDRHVDGDPSEAKFEEYNEVDAGGQGHGDTTIGLSICWQNSSALGGNCVDRGTFAYSTGSGTLKGTVSGCESFSDSDPFTFTLTVTAADGDLTGTTGQLGYTGCQPFGGELVAKLKTMTDTPPRTPAVCFD
ncbi:MAG TPA: hypothetical protein VH914_00600 [Acidimicrobiia bacterium]|jgi:hypothetical protein|nr:hypothetical protein [Acidimicrobiia bacterium]